MEKLSRRLANRLLELYLTELNPEGKMVWPSWPPPFPEIIELIIIAVKALLHDRESLLREKKELEKENERLQDEISGFEMEINVLRGFYRRDLARFRKREKRKNRKNRER